MEKEIASKLGRQDWLAIGIKILTEKGIEAVRIDPLAKLLNVTRGSFYWHFKNRDELLIEILHEWEAQNTKNVIEQIEGLNSSASDKLLSLFEFAAKDDDRLEKAVRIWAIDDERADLAIAQVDRQRLDYLRDLFLKMGFSKTDAEVRAQVAYSVRLGWFIMTFPSYPLKRQAEMHLVHSILTRQD